MQYNHHRSHACTLLCTALALAFGCAAAHAADVKISGSVITGLYFNKVEGVDNGNLKMGGAGELPGDPHLMLTAREDLGNGWYTGAQLQNRFYPDSGTFRSNGYLFDAQSRLFVGNDQIEFSFGRMAGLTVAGRPYSVYGKTNANMTFASLGGIAPANIMSSRVIFPMRSPSQPTLSRVSSSAAFIQTATQSMARIRKRLTTGLTVVTLLSSVRAGRVII